LTYVRSVFLEIVRVQYWQSIEAGKLPRQCFSAQFLLYTIDFGLDNASKEVGAQDWVLHNFQLCKKIIFFVDLFRNRDYRTKTFLPIFNFT
jgi:hypothetical protein